MLEKKQKEKSIEIGLAIRLRNVCLHVIYMLSLSELLIQLSTLLLQYSSWWMWMYLALLPIFFTQKPYVLLTQWPIIASLIFEGIDNVDKKKEIIIPTYIILFLNIQVWQLWESTSGLNTYDKVRKYYSLKDNFTCDVDPTSRGRALRPHTIFSQAFSQKEFDHLRGNMISLSLFAPWVIEYLGTYRLFFYFYVGSIYFSQFFNDILYRWLPEKRQWTIRTGLRGWISRLLSYTATSKSLGASGAVAAVNMFFYLSFCWTKLGTWACIELASLLVMDDLLPLLHNRVLGTALGDNVGYGAHVGGHVFGMLVWLSFYHTRNLEQDLLTGLPKWIFFMLLV